jgi:plastocyanin
MSTPLVATHTQERTRLSPLHMVMIAGLIGNILVNIILQVLIVRELIVPLSIILALTLVIAGIVASRWRWAPPLAVFWCIVSVIPGLEPYTYNLTHPSETGKFIATLLGLSLLLVTVVAGAAATFSGERQAQAIRAPRWLRGFLVGMAAFALGASLVATVPPPDATAGVSAEALAQLPRLGASHDLFDQKELRAKAGEVVALRLENSDAIGHFFDIDELHVHDAMPSGKPAIALFTPTTPGAYTFYCSVPGHREAGMVGTLIVEP